MIRIALKEAIMETSFATMINIPINYFLLSLAVFWDLTIMQTTILCTGAFFIIAIIRKTSFRIYFHNRYYHEHSKD